MSDNTVAVMDIFHLLPIFFFIAFLCDHSNVMKQNDFLILSIFTSFIGFELDTFLLYLTVYCNNKNKYKLSL